MKSTYRSLLVVAILLLAGLIWAGFTPGQSATAQTDGPVTEAIFRGTMPVVKFDISPALRDITPAEPDFRAGIEIIDDFVTGLQGSYGPQDIDPLVQSFVGPNVIPTPIVSFNGPANISGVQPPDPNGDVGPNHVVVMSNLSFQIFDKTGNSLLGPVANNTLWAGFGGDCQTDNSGDPVVLHDQFNDRWILSQFTASGPTYFNCVAISQTADPTGAYYRYAISTGSNFPDYPKYGVWSNAYYISTREFAGGTTFAGVGAYAIEIADVLVGNPNPTVLSFLAPPVGGGFNVGDGLLPADLDGNTLPPTDVEYFLGSMDDGGGYGAPQDALTLWEFTPDFVTPANSTFVLANTLPIAAFDTVFNACGGTRSCIPQPGTTNRIDILSYRQRPIWRLAYRNFGSHESLVTNQSVEATGGIAGNRWWEIRSPGSSPVIYQEGTYAPGTSDGIHRWMGSIAMDGSGNIAFAYSASDATSTFPSVWYTGRLAGDPLGQMTLGEGSIIDGTGSQTSGQRWGDYSSLTVDPTDDCTFWAVNEWLPVSGGNWTLRVGAFKFNECGTSDFTLSVTPNSQAICTPDDAVFNVNVGQVQGYTDQVTLSALGTPAGTTTTFSVNPVTPPGTSDLTIGSTGAAAAGSYSIDVVGVAATSTHTATVTLDVYTAAPGAPTLTDPANGATNVPVVPTYQWDAVAQASSYFIEVATDAGFTNIIDSATVSTNSYTPAGALAGGTEYFWRVTATNVCGDGAVSATFSFTTIALNTYCSAPALVIPDSTTVFDDMVVGNTGSLSDMNVSINATHTYVGDLSFTLTHQETGTSVTMVDRPGYTGTGFGCSGNNVNATLDDEGGDGPVENQCGTDPALFGSPTPNNPLSAFDGEDLSGTWIMSVSDGAGGDTGVLNEWCLEPTTEAPSAPSIVVDPTSLSNTQPTDTVVTETLTISNVGDADLNWSIDEDDQVAAPVSGPTTRQGSPTPRTTPLTLTAPLGTIVGDGGFEGGTPSAFWAEASTNFGTPLCDAGCGVGGGTGPHTGAWWAWFGGVAAFEEGSLSQNVTIPTGTATLSFWLEVPVACDSTADYLEVLVDGTQVYLVDGTYASCGVVGYALQTVDLSAYADNGSHSLEFHSEIFATNGTGTNFFVDDVAIDVSGPPPLCSAPADLPWVSVSPASGTTAAAGSDDVSVVLDSTGLADGVYTGTLCITSDDTLNPLVTVPLTLTVETPPPPTYGVVLSADDAATGLAGDVVSYVVTITNTGSTTDTFDLSAAGVWTATLSETSVTLASGASTTFTVEVDVPADAADGDSDVTTVTATSQGDVTATDSADYTTTAEVPAPPSYDVYLPLVHND